MINNMQIILIHYVTKSKLGLVNPVQFDNITQMITLSVRTQSRTTLSSTSTKKNEVPNFPGLGFICQPLKLVRYSFVCLYNTHKISGSSGLSVFVCLSFCWYVYGIFSICAMSVCLYPFLSVCQV